MRLKSSQMLALTAIAAAIALPSMASAYTQAPMLDKLVQDKKLPPVDQRLPEKPQVIKPVDKVGVYGGALRNALRGNGDQNAILRVVGNQGLVRWSMDFNNVEPNLAESWTVSPDATEFTFKLRKGAKWSDGTPFTADDVVFDMNDLVGNKQFYAAPPSMYVVDGKLVQVTKVDEYTVKFKFAGPYLSFLEQLATPVAQHATLWQKKYCSQFHPKYNPQANEMAAKEKAKDWAVLMRNKCGDTEIPTRWGNPDKPTMDPWVIKEGYGGGATRVVLERNPYFWQVDTKGQQLPYIDRVTMPIISEVETIVLAAINGQLDFQLRQISGIQNRPVLAENQAKGGYKIFSSTNVNANITGLWLNQTTKNDKLRKLMTQHDFREALSLGIDRKEINDIVYLGQAAPWQSGPFKESKWYNEKLGTQYLNLDVKAANAILDKMGLTKRDSDGFRQYPDGGRISIAAIVMIQQSDKIQVLELIRKQWQKIGVELVIQNSERSLFYDRASANNYDISVDVFPGGMDATLNPRAYLAVHPLESRMSLEWTKWYLTKGKQGIEPSESMKQRLALYDKWQTAKTQAEADADFKQILQLAADAFEVIGTVRPAVETGVHSKKLMNVFEKMPSGWTYPTPAPTLPQQWFFTK